MIRPPRLEFLSGIIAELPILVGVIPFGIIYGALAVDVGLPRAVAQAMSFIVFAGSSQIVITQLVGITTPAVVIVATAGVVNLRHVLYSASIAPYLSGLKRRWKWLLAYLLTDEAYAVSIMHYQVSEDAGNKHWFLLGSGLALWSTWQISTAVGIYVGEIIPASWSLEFTLTLTFIALVIPTLKDRASVLAAISAGIIGLLATNLPLKLGLLSAALVGILLGFIVEKKWS